MGEKVLIGATELDLVIGDITLLDVDAFVFYARSDLELGSGFGTAISVRGGPAVKKELAGHAPVATSDVVITSAGKLKAHHIFHAVGPRFQEVDTEGKLHATVINCLLRAEEEGLGTIAFPPLGAGFYGIPIDVCARIMVDAISQHLERGCAIEKVIIVALDSREYAPFEKCFERLNEKETVT